MSNIAKLGYYLSALPLDHGVHQPVKMFRPRAGRRNPPLISCVMPTRGHLYPARYGIECFRRQTFRNRELVVVCQSAGSEVERYLAELGDPRIRFFVAPDTRSVGEMRNFARDRAEGEYICVWDDDDLSHPDRLINQLSGIEACGASACHLIRVLLWWPDRQRLAVSEQRLWENTMLVRKSILPNYPNMRRGSDTLVVKHLRDTGKVVAIDHPASYCYVLHGKNLWGSDHFESFFAASTMKLDGPLYEQSIGGLARHVPIDRYAREQSALGQTAEHA